MHTQINTTFYKRNQSAYRQHHSCESGLLRLVNDILGRIERHGTSLISIDLSAVFGTVDHNILIDVLHSQHGMCGTALNWLEYGMCGTALNWLEYSVCGTALN